MGDNRARKWVFVTYPHDSEPDNWQEIMKEQNYCCALHDKDVDENGELKKEHRHWYLEFDGKKSLEQVKSIIAPLGGTLPLVCSSPRGSVRYLIHKDDPDKYQYTLDIIYNHGCDIDKYFQLSDLEISERKSIILKYIVENEITDYLTLQTALLDDYELLEVVQKNTLWATATLNGMYHCLVRRQK